MRSQLSTRLLALCRNQKQKNAIAALAVSVSTEATVLREGQTMRMASTQVVPGDLVWLAARDKVPADLRLVDASNLTVDELLEFRLNAEEVKQSD